MDGIQIVGEMVLIGSVDIVDKVRAGWVGEAMFNGVYLVDGVAVSMEC